MYKTLPHNHKHLLTKQNKKHLLDVMSGFNTVQNSSIILKWHSVSQWQRRNHVKIIGIQSLI